MPRPARLLAALLAATPLTATPLTAGPLTAGPLTAGAEPIQVAPVHAGTAPAPASLGAQPLDATQPASVINRAALDSIVAPTGNYDDAIRLSPSVIDVSPNGPGLGEAQILAIRGFVDGQYNVTFGGIPFADGDDFTHHGSAYFVARDLASVTVDRGPGSAATIGDATLARPRSPFGSRPTTCSTAARSTGSPDTRWPQERRCSGRRRARRCSPAQRRGSEGRPGLCPGPAKGPRTL